MSPTAHFALHWRMSVACRQQLGNVPLVRLQLRLTLYLMDERGFAPTLGDLVQATSLRTTTVSKYVRELLAAGSIRESTAADDRRRKPLALTAKGRREKAALVKASADAMARVTARDRQWRSAGTDFRSVDQLVRTLQTASGPKPARLRRKPRRPAG